MIHTKYTVNKETLAILPARAIDYRAIVLEKQQTYHIRQTPLEIIKKCVCRDRFFHIKRKTRSCKTSHKIEIQTPHSHFDCPANLCISYSIHS